jgi:hypothetical protein
MISTWTSALLLSSPNELRLDSIDRFGVDLKSLQGPGISSSPLSACAFAKPSSIPGSIRATEVVQSTDLITPDLPASTAIPPILFSTP